MPEILQSSFLAAAVRVRCRVKSFHDLGKSNSVKFRPNLELRSPQSLANTVSAAQICHRSADGTCRNSGAAYEHAGMAEPSDPSSQVALGAGDDEAATTQEDPHTPAEECPEEAEPMTPAEDAAPAPPSATAPEESAWESWESLREDEEDAEDEDGSYVRGGSRGELEVLDVNFCGRARRRLARHARRARIPLVSRALVVEEEFVDVDIVTNEVHDAEPDRTLHMEVSSDEAEANVSHVSFPQQSPAQMPRFEAQPSSSSSWAWRDEEPSLPPLLQVPLSPEHASPAEDTVDHSLPESWFQDPEDAEVASAPAGDASEAAGLSVIYVEPVRSGMEPRFCRECHAAFAMGELRLGYTPCGVTADGRQFLPVWVHAFTCARRARLAIRFDGESASFSPAVSLADRNRLVEELRQVHQFLALQHRSQPRQLCIRPWRYVPSVLQRWPVIRLQPGAPESESRPGWRIPSPPRRTSPPRGAPRRRTPSPPAGVVEAWSEDEMLVESDAQTPMVQQVLAQLVSGRLAAAPMQSLDDLPIIPNFLASTFSTSAESSASVITATTRLLAEVPVFNSEKKCEEPCVVCRDDITVGQECRRLPCMHIFHKECIDRWIAVKATCPLCNLKLEDLLREQHSLENGEEPTPSLRRSPSRSRSPPRPVYRPSGPPSAPPGGPRRSRWDLGQSDTWRSYRWGPPGARPVAGSWPANGWVQNPMGQMGQRSHQRPWSAMMGVQVQNQSFQQIATPGPMSQSQGRPMPAPPPPAPEARPPAWSPPMMPVPVPVPVFQARPVVPPGFLPGAPPIPPPPPLARPVLPLPRSRTPHEMRGPDPQW
ncbi:RING finger protein 165 [Symbiodinium microadriaticum]|uniref:RING finger protein 165 n=1 Tax=Symbiodinium microadriaticum TaxID=2951 RepID=A0A1Q9DLA9_SYMMI|nr:RING finger protein 165 [Symbiodinium microadriaticum]CAE7502939.1 RNF165 [Symbiodinium microadriaticum]